MAPNLHHLVLQAALLTKTYEIQFRYFHCSEVQRYILYLILFFNFFFFYFEGQHDNNLLLKFVTRLLTISTLFIDSCSSLNISYLYPRFLYFLFFVSKSQVSY